MLRNDVIDSDCIPCRARWCDHSLHNANVHLSQDLTDISTRYHTVHAYVSVEPKPSVSIMSADPFVPSSNCKGSQCVSDLSSTIFQNRNSSVSILDLVAYNSHPHVRPASLWNSIPHAFLFNAHKGKAWVRDGRVHITHLACQRETVTPDTFGTGAHRIPDLQNAAVRAQTYTNTTVLGNAWPWTPPFAQEDD